MDDRPTIILPEGFEAEPKPVMIPPKAPDFFGWVDHDGDANTFRFADIVGAQRGPKDGRYYIFVKGIGVGLPIPEQDYFRLLVKMGWTKEAAKTAHK